MGSPGTTPEQPVRGQGAPAPCSQSAEFCGLCGEPCSADPDIEAVAGLTICPICLEDMIYAHDA